MSATDASPPFTVAHALSCKKGGLVSIRHNDARDKAGALAQHALQASKVTYESMINNGRGPNDTAQQRRTTGTGNQAGKESRGDVLRYDVKGAPHPSQTLQSPSGFSPYRLRRASMNSSKDKHAPFNLDGTMESQIPVCLVRSNLFTSFFGALTFISSTAAFSFVTFSFRAATLAGRTCPRWVTSSRNIRRFQIGC